MDKRFSILHISDIHKNDNVSYESLLQSLEIDLQAMQNEGIITPSFVVVSGDLVQGDESEDVIKERYIQVESFLSRVCDIYLDSHRERMIIVPGNHDVDWGVTKASVIASTDSNEENYKQLFKLDNNVRWSWKDLKFFNINNKDEYENKLRLFIESYNRFFAGVRSYPKDPNKEAFIETFNDFNVSFAGFNSCYNVDHLCDVGNICTESLIYIGEDLRNSFNRGYLNIGVWHHNYYGSPVRTNYMDRHILSDMMQYNIQVGLFGHQHYAQVATEYVDFLGYDSNQAPKMTLISSGTLFGGLKELPLGCRRQYNIIEIEITNGKADIAINVREDVNNNLGSLIPYWRKKNLSNDDNKIHLSVQTRSLDKENITRIADKLIRQDHDYKYACELLSSLDLNDDHIRNLYFDSLKEISDYEYVYQSIPKVIKNTKEAFLLITVVKQLGKQEYISAILANESLRNLHDVMIDSELEKLSKLYK